MAAAQPLTVAQVCRAMDTLAPNWAAADWDNVGLLVGGGEWPGQYILLTIDLTPAVLDEAVKLGCNLIISYHPPIFRPIKRICPDAHSAEGLAAEALSRRIAIYSPHTALDAALGGTNDALAELAGRVDTRPFAVAAPPVAQCKLVVFVPAEQVDAVAESVFSAGAGRIGEYEKCSYRVAGHGTFFGSDAANPAVGQRGRLECVAEVRLEVVFPRGRLAEVIAAVRASHPYEEPAFDVYALESAPPAVGALGQSESDKAARRFIGQGRIGRLSQPTALGDLARSLGKAAGAENVTVVGAAGLVVSRAFVCAGAAGSLPFEAADASPGPGDVVITGEIRHHDALRYQRAGAAAIALGHWASERPVLVPLSLNLKRLLPGASITMSKVDADPFAPA
jgi:dinuclear metal center YbgI/SA1388 family protein